MLVTPVTPSSDYGATAATAVGLGVLALNGLAGAGVPLDLTTIDDVLQAVGHLNLSLGDIAEAPSDH